MIRNLATFGFVFLFALLFAYGWENLPVLPTSVFHALSDELFGLWVFDKISENLITHPWNLFDGKIFYPNSDTLAFAESMLPAAILYRLFLTLIGQKLLAYHFAVLSCLALDAMAMFALLRLFLSKKAAVFGGLIFGFSQLRLAQIPHVQLLPQMFFPLTAFYLVRYERSGNRGELVKATAMAVLQFYSCVYLGMILAMTAVPYLIARMVWPQYFPLTEKHTQTQERKRFLLHLALGGVLFTLLISPLAAAYFRVSHEHRLVRTLAESRAQSATVGSFFLSPSGSLWGDLLFPVTGGSSGLQEKTLFVGGVALVFAILGYKKIRRNAKPNSRFFATLFLVTGLWVVWLALGPRMVLYSICYYVIPGFKALRVPARFGFSFLFLLSALAGFGMDSWLSKLRAAGRYPRSEILFGLVWVAFCFENRVKLSFVKLPTELVRVTRELEMRRDLAPVVHLPIRSEYAFGERETVRMYYALTHRHPLVNGYSGFIPGPELELGRREIYLGPSEGILTSLKKWGVRYLVFEKFFPEVAMTRAWGTVLAESGLPILFEDDFVRLFEMKGVGGQAR